MSCSIVFHIPILQDLLLAQDDIAIPKGGVKKRPNTTNYATALEKA